MNRQGIHRRQRHERPARLLNDAESGCAASRRRWPVLRSPDGDHPERTAGVLQRRASRTTAADVTPTAHPRATASARLSVRGRHLSSTRASPRAARRRFLLPRRLGGAPQLPHQARADRRAWRRRSPCRRQLPPVGRAAVRCSPRTAAPRDRAASASRTPLASRCSIRRLPTRACGRSGGRRSGTGGRGPWPPPLHGRSTRRHPSRGRRVGRFPPRSRSAGCISQPARRAPVRRSSTAHSRLRRRGRR